MSIDNKVDMYISTFPEPVQDKLREIRAAILENASGCEEYISYAMPAYRYMGKPLVYFAVMKKHIGFYAMPSAHEAFDTELAPYKRSKSSVQFPLNKDLPIELITKLIQYRVNENLVIDNEEEK
jgi:uncharacterized protein YdhG (YjbR/CyaY superfamily)